ncbi:MAG: ribokinase [Alistipes sp.]
MNGLRKGKILVVGSTNTDMVVRTEHLPRPGETVLGGTFLMNPGGKGANQAVAAARLGADVIFVCKTGNDMFGITTRQQLAQEGIDTRFVFIDDHNPSGVALISVDSRAENTIVVASGANANLLPLDVAGRNGVDDCDIVLMQLETPMTTIEYVAPKPPSAASGRCSIRLPAPRCRRNCSKSLPDYVNETEAEIITGIRSTMPRPKPKRPAVSGRWAQNVIITLGSRGAYICNDRFDEAVPAQKVRAVDTTAAGDVFNGALVVALSEGKSLEEAVRFASRASAISVTRMGAQSSIPYRSEVDRFVP